MDSESTTIGEDELVGAIQALAAGDVNASVLIYRYLLGVAERMAAGWSAEGTACRPTLSIDIADETIMDVIVGAHTFCRERGSAKGWLYVIARRARERLRRLDGYDGISLEANGEWIEELLLTDDQLKDGGLQRTVRMAREHGFLSQAECNALWLALPSQRYSEAVAEFVFDDVRKSDAGQKRWLTMALRFDVFLNIAEMTYDEISAVIERARELDFIAAHDEDLLLHYMMDGSRGRAAAIRDTAWGLDERLRTALFGFAACTHLDTSDVRKAVTEVEGSLQFSAWCAERNWPEPYGRLLKNLTGEAATAADIDFWERVALRTRASDGSPRLRTLSVAEARRLAYDIATLARGVRRARRVLERHAVDMDAPGIAWSGLSSSSTLCAICDDLPVLGQYLSCLAIEVE